MGSRFHHIFIKFPSRFLAQEVLCEQGNIVFDLLACWICGNLAQFQEFREVANEYLVSIHGLYELVERLMSRPRCGMDSSKRKPQGADSAPTTTTFQKW